MERRILAECIVACALAMMASVSAGRADVVNLVPVMDNTLYQSPLDLSNGAGEHLFVGRTNLGNIRRAVLAFDIASNVPAGATIDAVSLTLHRSRAQGSASQVALYRLLSPWGEGASDAPGQEGGGAPAQPGDATWTFAVFNTDLWFFPGGDYAPHPSAVTTVESFYGPGTFDTWGSTTKMVADVQDWLDHPAGNFGWILIGDESTAGTSKRFDTRENPTEQFRPVLTIQYSPVPEPASLLLLAGGLAAGWRRRR